MIWYILAAFVVGMICGAYLVIGCLSPPPFFNHFINTNPDRKDP